MRMTKWIAIHASCAVLLLLAGAPTASADTINISTPNSALSGFTGPYATLTVNLIDSTDARIIFTSDTTNGVTFLMGGDTGANINIGSNVTISGPINIGTTGPFAPPFVSTYGSLGKNVDGFGVFNFEIDLFDGYTRAAETIDFTLSRNDGGTWANAADVLVPNAQGVLAAIHGFACTSPCTAAAGAITTGFAANGAPTTPIPEPTGMTLMGMALLAGYNALRRKA